MRGKVVSTVERSFVCDCVAAGRRIDGRRLEDARRVSVSLGPSWGFAEVSFDQTQVVATTTVEAVTPSPDRGNEGMLSISTELSPTSSEATARDTLHRSGVTSAVAETRNCIEKFVRESRAIDTEALCILAGVKVWSVRVDVDIINDDGNCVDVCVMAAMSSLMHARRPEVTVTGKELRIHAIDEREPVPLPVHHVPLAVSFALFGAGKPYESDQVVVDPVKNEEVSSGGTVSFAFNAQGEVCGVYKAGGLPLLNESFVKCSELGEKRALQLTSILKRSLSDASARHPLATVRPMLVNPEPVAELKSREAAREKMRKERVPMSTWNATPIPDAMPPVIGDNQAVKLYDDTVEADEIEAAFGDKDRVMETVAEPFEVTVDAKGMRDLKAKEAIDVNDMIMSDNSASSASSSSSSDDDLLAAVISKPKAQSGRR